MRMTAKEIPRQDMQKFEFRTHRTDSLVLWWMSSSYLICFSFQMYVLDKMDYAICYSGVLWFQTSTRLQYESFNVK